MNYTKGHLGPGKAEQLFTWLAKYKDRMHLWFVGFSHLGVLVFWDTKGNTSA